ncbi:IMP-specific 5'-nucleotidase, related [Neospora caninum Liverpool]|uniref:IMP-specific 5'-nucleotidase 1 n=1 Tax=Neospora caninum (strain Liverpool) TaxID=572307 RepID=F0V8R9_NEOCL|nr:IMP-specific 5'-nucleotidase, related [Neospora caninum Liverpool]CBZ50110.1 IMP-specific 5'-nucleotidase, related [Neospora caninum Liverpool]CEL64704.1 TPA: IMP-specific 5'-nucleotidase, related [Neospora caninum Liverpool]|eukprot:XP_003880145.1 IMP-specific 5'-nucleotidase, related [Neospora caninum Liverpool]
MAPHPPRDSGEIHSPLAQRFQDLPHRRGAEAPSPSQTASPPATDSSDAPASPATDSSDAPASPATDSRDAPASPAVCAKPFVSSPFCVSSGAGIDGASTGSWDRDSLQAGDAVVGRRRFAANHFLPLLTELFVALFKAHCFSSLVVRVLQAIEEEIVVDDAFVPYLTTPRSNAAWSTPRCGSADTGESAASAGLRGDARGSFSEPEDETSGESPPRSPPSDPDASLDPLSPVVDAAPARCVRKASAKWPLFCPPTISSFGSLSLHPASGPIAFPHATFEPVPGGGANLRHLWSSGPGSLAGAGLGRLRHEGEMRFFTKLRLVEAFQRVDASARMTKRKVVPPTFHECRAILNLAQILESRSQLRLITMDGDETLYPDGANFTDERIARNIAALLRRGTKVAVVTAAGYGYETSRYQERLGVLFDFLKEEKVSAEAAGNFYVMGGESNYLMQLSPELTLVPVDEALWTSFRPPCHPREAERLLDIAEAALRTLSEDLRLPACILRKERAVGLIRRPVKEEDDESTLGFGTAGGMHRENLEEIVMRVRRTIRDELGPQCMVPWSAFNGGKDVWVDIGNKAEGVAMLQGLFQLVPRECLHVGDQFGASGNDLPARVCSPTAWVASPQETASILHELLLDPERPEALVRGDSNTQGKERE